MYSISKRQVEAKRLPYAIHVDGLTFHLVRGHLPSEVQASQLPQLEYNPVGILETLLPTPIHNGRMLLNWLAAHR